MVRFYNLTIKFPPFGTCWYGSTLADPSLGGGSLRKTNADSELGLGSAWASVSEARKP